jgi:acetylornithine/succinyldiaminopimelate/putrescine aminotransferase
LFAYQYFDLEPDMVTLAKPLGGGLPIGAVLLRNAVAECLGHGDHGTTFGANPVACALALKVLEKLLAPGFLEEVSQKGAYMHQRLLKLRKRHPEEILEVRGAGMLAGVVTRRDPKALVSAFLERGILVCVTGTDAIRLIPPYVIKMRHIDDMIDAFHDILTHDVDVQSPVNRKRTCQP